MEKTQETTTEVGEYIDVDTGAGAEPAEYTAETGTEGISAPVETQSVPQSIAERVEAQAARERQERAAQQGVLEGAEQAGAESGSLETLATLKKRETQTKFLTEFLSNGGYVRRAAEEIGISNTLHYYWLENDETYSRQYDQVKQQMRDEMVAEAWRRGWRGWDKPIIYKGEITGTYKEYSDNLLMFVLKQLDPSFRENQTAIGIQAGGPVEVTFVSPQANNSSGKPVDK